MREGLRAGKTSSEIAREIGMAKSTVCYHRRRLGHEVNEKCNRRYDWPAVQRFYDTGHSKRECQHAFGFASKTWYDAVERGVLRPRPAAAPLETYLVLGRRVNRYHLKSRLLAAGLKQHACEDCGIIEWRSQRLSMALHHRNGDGLDNRLENLQVLCPNCHSQTETFGSLNSQRRRLARRGLEDRYRALGLIPVRDDSWWRLPVKGTCS